MFAGVLLFYPVFFLLVFNECNDVDRASAAVTKAKLPQITEAPGTYCTGLNHIAWFNCFFIKNQSHFSESYRELYHVNYRLRLISDVKVLTLLSVDEGPSQAAMAVNICISLGKLEWIVWTSCAT